MPEDTASLSVPIVRSTAAMSESDSTNFLAFVGSRPIEMESENAFADSVRVINP